MIARLVIVPRGALSQRLPVQASLGDFYVTSARNRSVTWLKSHHTSRRGNAVDVRIVTQFSHLVVAPAFHLTVLSRAQAWVALA